MSESETAAIRRFCAVMDQPDRQLNLAAAALMLAEIGHPDLDARRPMQELAALSSGFRARLSPDASPEAAAGALGAFLGGACGFRGNRENYDEPANSFLNDALRLRTGLPITLSIIYVEVGRRVGLDVYGVGFPFHFIVGMPADGGAVYLDPFAGGALLTRTDLAEMLMKALGRPVAVHDSMLQPTGKRDIILRMLRNLKRAYVLNGDEASALRVVNRLIAMEPQDMRELADRATLLVHLRRWQEARHDLEMLLRSSPSGPHARAARDLLETVRTVLGTLN